MSNNKPLRVLQVLTIMNRGGAESMIMNYYRNIDRSKVQFDFLLHRKEHGAYDNEIKDLGGRIYKLDAITPFRYFTYKKELKAFFSDHPEYRIVHSHLNALSYIVLREAKKSGIKIRIAHSHTSIDPKSLYKLFKKNSDRKALIKNYLQHLLRHRVSISATQYFSCSIKAGNWLFPRLQNEEIHIVNNAIDISNYKYNDNTRTKIRKELALSGKKIVGHVGLFKEEKNHFFLIDVFRILYQKDKNYHLLLVGDGPLMARVRKSVINEPFSKSITFLGMRSDIPILLQGMDFFVFPSIYEGLPVTLIEAQAAGLKIFCSNKVTKEVDVTGLIDFISLDKGPSHWAYQILSSTDYKRRNTSSEIQKGNYDIEENARLLSEFYINNFN